MIERWKDIPGYDGKYQASTEGNIRRTLKSGQFRSMTPYHKKMKGSQRLVVKLTKDGKAKEEIVLSLIARTFLGPVPDGAVPYHKNGMQSENHINNIAYIPRQELGKLTGYSSRNKIVVKLDSCGQDVEYYRSAREAAKKNFLSRQAITDRCNGKTKTRTGSGWIRICLGQQRSKPTQSNKTPGAGWRIYTNADSSCSRI